MTTEELRKDFVKLRPELDKQLPKECANCSETSDLQIHHIVPLSFGGSNRITNLARLCAECHSKAHGGFSFVEKASNSRKSAIAKGGRRSSKILYGYKFENGSYSIDENSAEIVRLIFRLRYEAELSTINIAEVLNRIAIPTAGTAKEWTHPVIKRMLDNRQYFGTGVFNGEVIGDSIYPAILNEDATELVRKFEMKYNGKRVPVRKLT